jgi:hypothetical protein
LLSPRAESLSPGEELLSPKEERLSPRAELLSPRDISYILGIKMADTSVSAIGGFYINEREPVSLLRLPLENTQQSTNILADE